MNRPATPQIALPAPARYTPFISGQYNIAAGLIPLDRDLGNGTQDRLVFQFDSEFPRYRENKLLARAEDLSRYAGWDACPQETMRTVVQFLVEQLAAEHPTLFRLEQRDDFVQLHCTLTGETLAFDNSADLGSVFDALVSQVQEDVAIVQLDAADNDRVVAVHVTAPSFWNPPSKLGKTFAEVHEPVPGMDKLNRQAPKITAMLAKDARYQRFGWSVTTDRRLNHHSIPPANLIGSKQDWYGAPFDPAQPEAYVRIERQVLIGFPHVSAFVFTIRPYLLDCKTLTQNERLALAEAMQSMSPKTREYKNIAHHAETIIAWLQNPPTTQRP